MRFGTYSIHTLSSSPSLISALPSARQRVRSAPHFKKLQFRKFCLSQRWLYSLTHTPLYLRGQTTSLLYSNLSSDLRFTRLTGSYLCTLARLFYSTTASTAPLKLWFTVVGSMSHYLSLQTLKQYSLYLTLSRFEVTASRKSSAPLLGSSKPLQALSSFGNLLL